MIQDIVGRAQRLLLSPDAEWEAISGEPANMGEIYRNYVLPLVVFSALCVAVGFLMADMYPWFILRTFILSVVIGLISVYLFSLIIDALVPTFGGQKNSGQAFKVAAYAPTAVWLASVFKIVPVLDSLSFLGIYSFYLLYVGLLKLMKCPNDKAIMCTIVIIVCAFVLGVILSFLLVPLYMAFPRF